MPDEPGGRSAVDVRLRRAGPEDVPYLVALGQDPEVEPYLAGGRAQTPEELLAEIEHSRDEPDDAGRFVIEARSDGVEWHRAGTVAFSSTNRRSRIAWLGGLAVDPAWRGRGLGVSATRLLARLLFEELRFHRLETEVYGFNERGRETAEQAGFVPEGVKRRAYWRHEVWQDSFLLGLLAEELEPDRGSPA
ncbi:MAG: GNAT family N-acetyltransferase [Gaiellaceae bacterium]